ncbi:MAG: GNAT family N-acetyltransferase, partial [Solirubrobacterales bacterium]|nr:GNAT family N-acetyltransferase [Solirubrobacterales bacterium]
PQLPVDALVDFADEALAGLEHRRVDFDLIEAADSLRGDLESRGWRAMRQLFLRHEGEPPPTGDTSVEEVPYDSVHALRVAWHREESPAEGDAGDADAFHAQAQAVAMRQGSRVLALMDAGTPIGYAQLEHRGEAAEISQVYVHPERRGAGLGTAITRAAIVAAGSVSDLWIGADDEDRAKDLYMRLGFRPAWMTMEFTLLPTPATGESATAKAAGRDE